MISMCLLAAHMLGDYILQTDYLASKKLTNWKIRLIHVWFYTMPFAVIGLLYDLPWLRLLWFVLAVAVPHFVIDSRRFCTKSPWVFKPLMVDQTLHMVCLAITGVIFFGR